MSTPIRFSSMLLLIMRALMKLYPQNVQKSSSMGTFTDSSISTKLFHIIFQLPHPLRQIMRHTNRKKKKQVLVFLGTEEEKKTWFYFRWNLSKPRELCRYVLRNNSLSWGHEWGYIYSSTSLPIQEWMHTCEKKKIIISLSFGIKSTSVTCCQSKLHALSYSCLSAPEDISNNIVQ